MLSLPYISIYYFAFTNNLGTIYVLNRNRHALLVAIEY